ncbi:MAG: phosphate ABC transporter permease PstA [Clostridia bacterium]|nr:phosphate ABC transporter permease PstA [Clostridia bacterium]
MAVYDNNKNRRRYKDNLIKASIFLSAFLTVAILVWILGYVVFHGIGEIDTAFLTTEPSGDEGGVWPMILTTLYMIILAIGISAPIGILSAIYLVEYAKPGRILRVIRFATESLAGIPSIIFGLFGMIFFVVYLKMGWCILSGAITLSIMVLPTIIRTTEEALKSVPMAYREGSLGLGATKLRTIWKCVLPSAIPGILTSVILSIGRVVGETAAVYLTAGMAPYIPKSAFESGRTLAVHLYLLAKEGISFEKAFATATVLIMIILVINILANMVGRQLNKINKV